MSQIRKVTEKTVKPKVFALLHELRGMPNAHGHALYVTPAYTLEDADKEAKLAIQHKYNLPQENTRLAMHVSADAEQMMQRVTQLHTEEAKEVDVVENFKDAKNRLMKSVLDTKDKNLFQEVRPLLLERDVKYLQKGLKESTKAKK